LTNYETQNAFSFTLIIGVNSTIYMFNTLPSTVMLIYDTTTGNVTRNHLTGIYSIQSPFTDGQTLYLIVSEGINTGVCEVSSIIINNTNILLLFYYYYFIIIIIG
jgi:hypothetical protein